MRHHFKNDSRPKSVAKSIRAELLNLGFKLSHSDSLLLVAKLYHYRNWGDLVAHLGKHPPSLDDQEAGNALTGARFTHHVGVLVDYGLDREVAMTVVQKIGPTSSGVRQLLGREELWVDDAAVTAHLDSLAFQISREAAEVQLVRHGTWLGFIARFEPRRLSKTHSRREARMRNGGTMLFGVSHDGRSAILRERRELADVSFQEAVDDRIHDRQGGTTDEWSFLDGYPSGSSVSQLPEGARVIGEVFSLLHVPSLRAMRSKGTIRELDYERAVPSDRLRSFLHRYPSLADHCFWSLELSKDNEHLGSRKWIEGSDPDTALMAMLTRGNLPSGESLVRVRRVAEALKDYAITSDGNDAFSTNALEALAHIGPSAIPTSKAEMTYLIRSADEVSNVLMYGMDLSRGFKGFNGLWKPFYQAIRGSKAGEFASGLYLWPDSFVYMISSAFGQTYGIDPDLLYGQNFTYAVIDRIGSSMMARMSMIDIATLRDTIDTHSATVAYSAEERYPTVAEADELASLFALPMPDTFHGKSCIEILKLAGYDTDALAGMLKLEPDLTFDSMGLPVLEQRFEGLDRSTYAVAPLKFPRYDPPAERPRRRPSPMPPPEVPEAPFGWVFEGGEFKSTGIVRSSRIRWSDGENELNGKGPGWYADLGHGPTQDGSEPRCPVRLGRFESPADAAEAIKSAKGH